MDNRTQKFYDAKMVTGTKCLELNIIPAIPSNKFFASYIGRNSWYYCTPLDTVHLQLSIIPTLLSKLLRNHINTHQADSGKDFTRLV